MERGRVHCRKKRNRPTLKKVGMSIRAGCDRATKKEKPDMYAFKLDDQLLRYVISSFSSLG